tara:strand:+ start:68 stop:463 length:396 start_codon:yes stop_codon:yes gene_type:complete
MKILIDTICAECKAVRIDVFTENAGEYPDCTCGAATERLWSFGVSVRGDEIPGGVWIHHGLCNTDGTPRRYDSYTEINRECKRRGLTRWTDMYDESETREGREHLAHMKSAEYQQDRRERREARLMRGKEL